MRIAAAVRHLRSASASLRSAARLSSAPPSPRRMGDPGGKGSNAPKQASIAAFFGGGGAKPARGAASGPAAAGPSRPKRSAEEPGAGAEAGASAEGEAKARHPKGRRLAWTAPDATTLGPGV